MIHMLKFALENPQLSKEVVMAIRGIPSVSSFRRAFVNNSSLITHTRIDRCYKSVLAFHSYPRTFLSEKHESCLLINRVIPKGPSQQAKEHFFIPPEKILKKENQKVLGVKPMSFNDYKRKHLISYDEYYNKYCKSYDEKTLKTGYELYCISSYNGYLNSLEFASPTIL
jgi:hypothetical protein